MSRYPTKVDFAASEIRAAIAIGRLSPGDRILTRSWAMDLGVSLGPLREALRILEANGQVTIDPHRGASVSLYTPEDLAEAYRVRASLDGLAAEFAAEKLSVAQSGDFGRELMSLNSNLATALDEDDIAAAHRLNRQLHRQVYDAAASPRLDSASAPFADGFPSASGQYWRALITSTRQRAAMIQEHETLIEAICSGNSRRAYDAAHTHVTQALALILAAPP